MAITLMSSSFFLRRALARSSLMLMPGVSSMKSLQSLISSEARLMPRKSDLVGSNPFMTFDLSKRARA